MSLRINSEAPNFTADTTQGPINFHDFIGNDTELGTTLAVDLHLAHLRKQASGNDYAGAAARRVLSVTGIQLRMLANDLEAHGRTARAEIVRSIAHQTEL